MFRLLGFALTALIFIFASLTKTAEAGATANVGYASEYYFRGLLQKQSSASAGLDYEEGMFSVGTWVADVGQGLEYDIYGAASYAFNDDFSVSLGGSGYFYTDEAFDNTYTEINFNVTFKMINLEYTLGTRDGDGAPDEDYDFFALTVEHLGFYGTYGTFGDEYEGDYIELGYGATVSEIDLGVALIFSSDELSDQFDSSGAIESEALIFTIGKTFDL